jgi:hypothetical protein
MKRDRGMWDIPSKSRFTLYSLLRSSLRMASLRSGPTPRLPVVALARAFIWPPTKALFPPHPSEASLQYTTYGAVPVAGRRAKRENGGLGAGSPRKHDDSLTGSVGPGSSIKVVMERVVVLPGGSSPRPPFLASLGALSLVQLHNCLD